MRTFIAVELSPAVKRPLLKLLRDLPQSRDVKWVNEWQLHLTLKFLGEVSDTQLPQVCDAAEQVCREVAPFPLSVTGLGCFPGRRNPRVLWCGIEDATTSTPRWVELIDPLISNLGFKPETRAYTPHITLGRSRSTGGGRVMQQVLDDVTLPATEEMLVKEVTVFESRLLPGGAQYHPLARIALAGTP